MATKKRSDKVHTGIRMPRDLFERIQKVAAEQKRPLTNMMRILMEKGLEVTNA